MLRKAGAMAKWNILYWQEIPSMVEVRDRSGTHKVQLSARFQELIDMAAMRRGLADGDAYLEAWHRQRQPEREGQGQELAEALAAELEAEYPRIRSAVLTSLGRHVDE